MDSKLILTKDNKDVFKLLNRILIQLEYNSGLLGGDYRELIAKSEIQTIDEGKIPQRIRTLFSIAPLFEDKK